MDGETDVAMVFTKCSASPKNHLRKAKQLQKVHEAVSSECSSSN